MSEDTPVPDDDELLAAEFAFGLLDKEGSGVAERRSVDDPSFHTMVQRWQDHAAMFVGTGEAPPESVWHAIQRGLPANDAAPVVSTARLRRWQGGALVATISALAFGGLWLETPSPPPERVAIVPGPPLVAILRGKSDAVVAVSFEPMTRRLTTTSAALDLAPHAAELWVIPGDGRPRSLGVIGQAISKSRIATGPLADLVRPGVTLAISVEPAGGSRTGAPTGAVILSGKVEPG